MTYKKGLDLERERAVDFWPEYFRNRHPHWRVQANDNRRMQYQGCDYVVRLGSRRVETFWVEVKNVAPYRAHPCEVNVEVEHIEGERRKPGWPFSGLYDQGLCRYVLFGYEIPRWDRDVSKRPSRLVTCIRWSDFRDTARANVQRWLSLAENGDAGYRLGRGSTQDRGYRTVSVYVPVRVFESAMTTDTQAPFRRPPWPGHRCSLSDILRLDTPPPAKVR